MQDKAPKLLLQVNELVKSYGSKKLYESSSFSIAEGEKYCLYGPNGSGKSTLFRILTEEEECDTGVISWRTGVARAYLKQNFNSDFQGSLNDYVTQLESGLPEWNIKKIANGLGLTENYFEMALTELSGGYRMRFFLSLELAREPDLLFLDEPTNHLDLESVIFLEEYLNDYKKAFVLISHDRELIDNVCNKSLVIDDGEIMNFPGSLEEYFEFSESLEEQKERENTKILQKKKQLERFIERFGAKNTKAKQAKSKQKQIDRLGNIQSKKIKYFPKVPIPEALSTGKRICESEASGLSYPGKNILKAFELNLFRSQKIAIVGENGAGKTTLLKYLAGVMNDDSELGPRYFKNAEPAYFAQHLEEELELDSELFAYVTKKASVNVSDQEISDLLGHLGFGKHDWDKKLSVLSGGEKMRVVLAEVLLKKSPFLLLDEPTNHLDFQTVEALAEALKETDALVVFVSHDRSFVNKVANQIYEVKNQVLQIYPGNYQDYLMQKALHKEDVEKYNFSNSPSLQEKQKPEVKTNFKEQKKMLEKRKRELEKKAAQLEENISETELKLVQTNKELVEYPDRVSELLNLLNELGKKKEDLEQCYFNTAEKLEHTESELDDLLN